MRDDSEERRRLVAALYSREGAAQEAREYQDPVTNRMMHLTPAEKALAAYDAAHTPREAMPERATDAAPPPSSEPTAPAGSVEPTVPTSTPAHPSRFLLGLVIGAVGGSLTVGVAAGVQPQLFASGSAATAAPTAPTGMIDAVFASRAYPRAETSAAVALGFDPSSFRTVGDDFIGDDGTDILAARRDDGEYCLVAVSNDERVVSVCGTGEEIGTHGLRMEKNGTRTGAGELFTLIVTWQRDGLITWTLRTADS